MALPRKKGKFKSSSQTGGSPIDSRQRELSEEELRVQERIKALQQEISQGAAKPVQRPRKPSAPPPRRAGPPVFRSSAVLVDSRFDENEAVPMRNKPRTRLRRERRQQQLQTAALIVALLAAALLALHWLAVF